MDLIVHPDGRLEAGGKLYRCALGKNGIRKDKREGDNATPSGRFALRQVFYRPDRVTAPQSGLKVMPLSREDGWCDDPGHADYNRQILLPHPARHETLWREDRVYDVILVLGHNDDPVVTGAGSAVFMHVARENYQGTEGCIALALPDLLEVLTQCGPGDQIIIPDPE